MILGTHNARSRFTALAAAAAFAVSLAPLAPAYAAYPAAPAAPSAPTKAQAASMPFADSTFENVWSRNDQPVASKAVARSWMWGPAPLATGTEPYADAPDK